MAETKMSAREALEHLTRKGSIEGPGAGAGVQMRELHTEEDLAALAVLRELLDGPELAVGRAMARVVDMEERGGAPSATWAEVYAELGRATQALRERARSDMAARYAADLTARATQALRERARTGSAR